VPYTLRGKTLDACISQNRVEILDGSVRVAVHIRSDAPNKFSTLEEHMPPSHQWYCKEQREGTVEYLLNWSKQFNPVSQQCVEMFFKTRVFPEQGVRAVLGLRRLVGKYGKERFEQACERATRMSSYRYKTIEECLRAGLCQTVQSDQDTCLITNTQCFRGADYYK
jgi:hypothetical protein